MKMDKQHWSIDSEMIRHAVNRGELVKIIVDGTETVANLLDHRDIINFLINYKGEYFIEYGGKQDE